MKMKWLRIQLSEKMHQFLADIKYFYQLKNKTEATEKALELANKQFEKEAEKNEVRIVC